MRCKRIPRQLELQLLRPPWLPAARVIGDAVNRHAMVVCQDAANPHAGGQLILGRSHSPAGEILRSAYSAGGVHIDGGVSEHARGKDRDRDERWIGREERHYVRGEGHLGGVELPMPQHAEERLLDRQVQIPQVDAVGLDAALGQRPGPVVVPAPERQAEFGHFDPPRSGEAPLMFPHLPPSRGMFRAELRRGRPLRARGCLRRPPPTFAPVSSEGCPP